MQNSKQLLIIGFVWPEPRSSAAGSRMMQLIGLFLEYGYAITFATTAQNLEFSENLQELGVSTAVIQLNASSFDDFVKGLHPNVVLFDRFMTEEQFGWRVSECCPEALKILNTEDLHSLRQARQVAVSQNRPFDIRDLFASDMAKREIAAILRSDLSLMVSEFEMELLQKQFKMDPGLLYHLPIFAEKLADIPTFDERNDFVFIGNFLHEPNWDAVKYLSAVIWPRIHTQLPKAKLCIYGAYPSQKVLKLHQPKLNFYIMGRVGDAFDVVKKAKVVLAPIRFGAGIKGKLLEAMQCGTPSVTTNIGAESMPGNMDWNGFIEDNPDVFSAAAVGLYRNKDLWEKCRDNGFEILEKRYHKALFEAGFSQRIAMLLKDLSQHRNTNFIGAMLQHHLLSSTKYLSRWIEEKNQK